MMNTNDPSSVDLSMKPQKEKERVSGAVFGSQATRFDNNNNLEK